MSPRIVLALCLAAAFALPRAAAAQAPQAVWKLPSEASFDLQRAVDLYDDGATAGDLAAADGLYTGLLDLPADATDPTLPRTVEYVVVPPGGDLTTALGAADGTPMQLALADGQARTVTVRYATARDPDEPLTATCADPDTVLACKGFAPVPSISDEVNAAGAFAAVGDFQADLGAAPWDVATGTTELTGGAFTFLTARGFDGAASAYEIASTTRAAQLSAQGWSFEAAPSSAGASPLTAPAWQVVRFEARPERGMVRVVADPAGVAVPLLTEVSTDAAAPFIELVNRAAEPLALAGLHLGDTAAYPQASTAPAVDAADFAVALPGARLAPGAYLTVSLVPAADFQTAYGALPDLVLSDLSPSWAGSVGAAPGLEAAGGFLALFTRPAGTDLVRDVDLVVWGTGAAPLKTGVTVGTATYGDDAGTVNAAPAPAAAHLARRGGEGAESTCATCNGVLLAETGLADDETSEDLAATWAVTPDASPGDAASGFTFLVSGTVTEDGTGTPMEGVTVTAASGASTTTSASGSYALRLPEGADTLTATFDGYLDAVQAVAVDADLTVDLVLVPNPGVRVSGRVERETGAVLAGARVVLDDGTATRETTTGAAGGFSFTGVQPGAYTVRASLSGYRGASTAVPVADANVGGIVLVLRPIPAGYDVSGRVEDAADGSALAGAVLEIADAGLLATTDASGAFTFRLVPPGTWTMAVAATGYAAQTAEVTVTNAPVTGVRVALAKESEALTLRGKVRVANLDLPVPGAEVRLTPDGGAAQTFTTTAVGDYVFGGLPAGHYAIAVTAEGYATARQELDLAETTTLDFDLDRAAGRGFTLSGKVQLSDRDEGSWGGSTITVTGPASFSVSTASDGTYERADLAPGVYRVTAAHGGYVSAAVSVTLTADTAQGFILEPESKDTGASPWGCAAAAGGGAGALPLLLLLWPAALTRVRRRR